MASVTKAPRARTARTRRPAPPVADQAIAEARSEGWTGEALPEGWQPGGAHPSRQPVAVAKPAPSAPPVRHGKCSITLSIGGNEYRVARALAGPPVEGVVTLRKISSDPASGPAGYALATDGLEIKCTCPDHSINGATCKHIMAIVAVARILAPFAAAAEGGAL